MKFHIIFILAVLALSIGAPAKAVDTGFKLPPQLEKRVEEGIEARKSPCLLIVGGRNNEPRPNAKIEIKQVSSEFLFGCAFPSWNVTEMQAAKNQQFKQFERLFLNLFNYVTTENMLKWSYLEAEEGKPDYTLPDGFVKWAKDNNLTIKGHCLVWGHKDGGYPQWLNQYDKAKAAQITEKHVKDVVDRYKGSISYWDVVNEPLHEHALEQLIGPDYASLALKWAHQADPKAVLVVNEYANLWNGQAPQFADYIGKLTGPLDAVGEQFHDPPRLPSPTEVFDMLDALARTGKDIHLTEVTWPSNGAPVKSDFVTGKWDEATQGKFYRYLYTLAFSHPKVKAITLWAMWDKSSWLDKGGIVGPNWELKPAYKELDSLINKEWRTQLEGRSNADGSFRFKGFRGKYLATVTDEDRTYSKEFTIADKKNVLRIVLPY